MGLLTRLRGQSLQAEDDPLSDGLVTSAYAEDLIKSALAALDGANESFEEVKAIAAAEIATQRKRSLKADDQQYINKQIISKVQEVLSARDQES